MSIKSNYYKERKRIERYIKRLERAGAEVEFNVPNIPKRITSASVSRLQKITPDKILAKTTIETIDYETAELKTVSGRAVLGTIQRRESYKKYEKESQQNLKPEIDELINKNAEEIQKKATESLNRTRQEAYYPKQEEIIFDNLLEEISVLSEEEITEDSVVLDTAISDLMSFTPKSNWNNWYTYRKRKQVNKLLSGISQAIREKGRSAVAREFNNNAVNFNRVIDSAIGDSGNDEYMQEIDRSIDELINSLMGAMSYEDAEFYGE